MLGYVIVERRADAVLKTSLTNLRLAGAARLRVEKAQTAVAQFLATRPQKAWISEEEAARIGRRRSLLDDNPASG